MLQPLIGGGVKDKASVLPAQWEHYSFAHPCVLDAHACAFLSLNCSVLVWLLHLHSQPETAPSQMASIQSLLG